jgi:alpha-glucosidase
MEQEGDKLLIAEHFHDAGPDLDGDGWHGAMNYSAFMKPMWSWIVGESFDRDWLGMPNRVPSTTGRQMVSSIQSFAARMPWRSYNSSWSLLDSHDTARIRSVAGGRDRHHVAAAMMMTLPGTPMIFAGDEIGAEGLWGEDSRTTFPWDNKESWDMETFSVYKDLIALRKSREALIEGGLRWIHVEDDLVVYLRESKNETLLIAAARNAAKASIDVSRFGFTKSQPILGQVHTAEGALLQLDFPRASFAIWSLA